MSTSSHALLWLLIPFFVLILFFQAALQLTKPLEPVVATEILT